MGVILFLLPWAVILFVIGIRIVDQYEEAVVLTLGKFTSIRKPGLNWIFPVIQRMIKVDLRILTVDVPRQEAITKDNVTLGVDAVVYFKVANTQKAVLDIQNYKAATILHAQAAMRDIVGQSELDTLLSERERISNEIQDIVDKETDKWGIDVQSIMIQNIELPQDMKRVIAKQAEAEREKRSVITKAEGEAQAADNLSAAATKLAKVPGALHLRTLTTLNDLSSDQSNTVIFAVPLEVLRAFEKVGDKNDLKDAVAKFMASKK